MKISVPTLAVGLIFVCWVAYSTSYLNAAELVDQQIKALDAIKQAAKEICNTVPPEGNSTNVELSADASAKLDGLIKKLANLGIGAAGKYTSEEYKGVLRKDLANLLKDNADCKLKVLTLLQDKMIVAGDSSTNPAASAQSAEPTGSKRMMYRPYEQNSPLHPLVIAEDSGSVKRLTVLIQYPLVWPSGQPNNMPAHVIKIYSSRTTATGTVAGDPGTFPSFSGSWNPGDQVKFQLDVPDEYFDPTSGWMLRCCIGEQQMCLPSPNLLMGTKVSE
jgi:hypothetical protein